MLLAFCWRTRGVSPLGFRGPFVNGWHLVRDVKRRQDLQLCCEASAIARGPASKLSCLRVPQEDLVRNTTGSLDHSASRFAFAECGVVEQRTSVVAI